MWLKTPVEETDKDGGKRLTGGKRSKLGTVISPLLANVYMNRFLKYWRLTEQGRKLKAHVINYADDFVILSRGCAAEAKAWTAEVMSRLGLKLNETKTCLRNACNGASPSKKSVARLKPRISAILRRGNKDPWQAVCEDVNPCWSAGRAISTMGPVRRLICAIDHHVATRVNAAFAMIEAAGPQNEIEGRVVQMACTHSLGRGCGELSDDS